MLLVRPLIILDGATADVFHDFVVLDVEPLLEDLQAPVLRPHLYVRVPVLDFSAEDFIADLLQNLLGVGRVLVVRHEIERLPKRYRDETALTFQIQTGRSLTATGFDRDAVQPTMGSSRASSTTTCSPAPSTKPVDEMASCGSMLTSVA